MNRSLKLALAMVLVAATSSSLHAVTVINLDFGPHGDHPGGVVSAPYTGLGAAYNPGGTTWNSIEVLDNNAFQGPPGEFGFWTTTVNQSNLLNSVGAASSIGVSVVGAGSNGTGAFGVLQGSPNLGAVATDAVNLMRDYLIGFDAPRQVILNGFAPSTAVDLYLYGAGDTNNRDTQFTITDSAGTHSATTTGTITGDGNNPVAHTLTLGGDYVVLTSILADNTGAITINYFHGAGSGEAPFNGLQAVFGRIAGDANDDNHVDLLDYQLIRDNFRKTNATRLQGDVTGPAGGNAGDGVVDFYDFMLWQAHYPTAVPLGIDVPEPASFGMGLVALAVLSRLRRTALAAQS